ncbi:hypothetical protein GGI43DRAFT_386808 [Trichoderma evansii]
MSTDRTDNGAMNPTAAPFVPFASPQPSFATQYTKNSRSNIQNKKHENKEATLPARDQMLRPTAPNSSELVHQNPSPRRLKINPLEGISHEFFFRRRRTNRIYRAGSKISRKSKPNISGGGASQPLKATPSQQYRMSSEEATAETEEDNGSAPEKDSQTMSTEDVLVPSPAPGPMPPGANPAYVFSTIPSQQHDGGMILHSSHPVLPSIYPPPPQGGCFSLLHMVPYRMMPGPTDQPQPPGQFAFAVPMTYWPHRNFPVGNAGSQINQQNPDCDLEQMNHGISGHPMHSHPPFISCEQVPYMPHHITEQHARLPIGNLWLENLDENKAIDQGSDIIEKRSDKASDNEVKLSDYYQGVSERMKPPSAVDGLQAREKTGEEDWQRLQQSRQVPLGPQQRHNQQITRFPTMQSSSVVTSPSSRFSRRSHVTDRPSKVQTSTEVASWSQSKRWVSSETKERRAFQKMILNLQFMKADHSPFIPKTPAELTKFKISLAEAKRQKLAKEVKILEEKSRNKELAKASGSKPVSQPQVLLFNGRQMEDKLSPVFAAQNCFNKEDTAKASQRVEWPSLAELKEEGDKRARFGRYLPLPRMNVVAPKILEREQESAYKADGSIL